MRVVQLSASKSFYWYRVSFDINMLPDRSRVNLDDLARVFFARLLCPRGPGSFALVIWVFRRWKRKSVVDEIGPLAHPAYRDVDETCALIPPRHTSAYASSLLHPRGGAGVDAYASVPSCLASPAPARLPASSP